MPKPGYYYYQNKRALKGIVFLGVFVFLGYFAKNSGVDRLSEYDFLTLYKVLRVPALVIVVIALVALYGLRRGLGVLTEPHPSSFIYRQDFIDALTRYGERKGYAPGWVYYRGQELWPQSSYKRFRQSSEWQ